MPSKLFSFPFCLRRLILRRGEADQAFTLLELLAVIGLIAVLSGIVLGAGRRAIETGRSSRAKNELAVLAAALESYRLRCGDYPRTEDTASWLQALIGRRGPLNDEITMPALIELAKFTTAGQRDPFTDASAVLVDPWGVTYRYAYRSRSPWSNPSYVLYSTGPDGHDTGTLLAGGFVDPAAEGNADNICANQP
jgi:general secretion pathway protein G